MRKRTRLTDEEISHQDAALTEKQFEAQIKELAKVLGWKYYHTWRSIHSPAGFPDCVLAKPPRLIFAELKSQKGKLTPLQEQWLELLRGCPGVEAYCWMPSDFDHVVEILRKEVDQ